MATAVEINSDTTYPGVAFMADGNGEGADTAGLRYETARLKEENERLNQEMRREHEMYIRNLADFDNYRRRVERERAQAAQAGKRELILRLLELMDDFERALDDERDDPQSPAVSLRAIRHRLVGLLAAQGVTSFESKGQHFNPLLHETVGLAQSDTAEPGTVLCEISRGWQWGDELLRPARVKLSQ
jgi:molecular chaperone GrpE